MTSFSESEPVFVARCLKVGLSETDVAAFKAQGIRTLANVAFMSSYTPGSGDDAALMRAFEKVVGGTPTLGQQSSFRRLFHEAFAVSTHEMQSMVEATEDTAPRRLSVPERAERFQAIKKRLVGLSIKDRTEPSDSLVDACVHMYESNRLSFLEWEKLTSKEHEAHSQGKRDSVLSLDSNGKLKLEKPEGPRADTTSDLQVQMALNRRGVALEMANILSFTTHSAWVDRLMAARLDPVPDTHVVPSIQQLLSADRKLFQVLSDKTRAGVQATPQGRPVEACFKEVSESTEVLTILQPLPKSASGPVRTDPSSARSDPYPPPQVRHQRPKGRGKGGGKARVRMPTQLIGCRAHTNAGDPICFGYGLKTCKEIVRNGRCPRGLHICAVPKCGKYHPALDCPSRDTMKG